jgi:hypothetical protein
MTQNAFFGFYATPPAAGGYNGAMAEMIAAAKDPRL